ncbi:TIMELESS-interacting protein [Pholidichthys leucotaenia]
MFDPEENGLSDIPDFDGLEDEAFPPLPPPHTPGQGGQDGEQPFGDGEEGEVSKLADVPAAKRRGVKRPQPKLDSQRLISERGLPTLRTLFDNIRFKGKGHEAEDLRLLMQKMENWAHRLYPKLQFEDFIDRVEKLGNKKEVQTCLRRIRLDMPLIHEDFMGDDGDPAGDVAPEMEMFGDPDPFSRESLVDDAPGPVHSTPAPMAPLDPAQAAASLTEEQRRRMELNRQRALERRLTRRRQQNDSQTAADTSSLDNGPPSVSTPTIRNNSTHGDESMEDVHLEAVASMQAGSQTPPKDSEAPAESVQGEEQPSPLSEPQPGGCEEGE